MTPAALFQDIDQRLVEWAVGQLPFKGSILEKEKEKAVLEIEENQTATNFQENSGGSKIQNNMSENCEYFCSKHYFLII